MLLQSLPAEVQQKYADPRGGSAGAGWSCGVEFLEDGTPDTYKGSYFANPLFDTITEDSSLQDQYPGYLTLVSYTPLTQPIDFTPQSEQPKEADFIRWCGITGHSHV